MRGGGARGAALAACVLAAGFLAGSAAAHDTSAAAGAAVLATGAASGPASDQQKRALGTFFARVDSDGDGQGLTLVHCSAQLERFVWDKGVRVGVV